MKISRPMKAARGKIGDPIDASRFPLWVSPKYDGIRGLKFTGALYTSKMKLVPCSEVQDRFRVLPPGLDGELVYGAPTSPDSFRRTTSIVMSSVKSIPEEELCRVRFHIFDLIGEGGFEERRHRLISNREIDRLVHGGLVTIIPQYQVVSLRALLSLEARLLREGYEGVIVRDPVGLYKQGRSTVSELYSMKRVPIETDEATITGWEERQHNGNEATIDERGYTKRSKHSSGMTGMGTLGALVCKWRGTSMRVGSGFTDAERDALWARRDGLLGGLVKFKMKGTGMKDRPREPIYLGLRSVDD